MHSSGERRGRGTFISPSETTLNSKNEFETFVRYIFLHHGGGGGGGSQPGLGKGCAAGDIQIRPMTIPLFTFRFFISGIVKKKLTFGERRRISTYQDTNMDKIR